MKCCAVVLILVATIAISALPANAQSGNPEIIDRAGVEIDRQLGEPPINLSGLRLPPPAPTRSEVRDTVTIGMYGVFGVLQALDVHSTLRAVDRGATEANPFIRPFVSSPSALISFKAASSVGVLYLAERIRRKHPVAALALVIGLNSAHAYVVAQNYRVANR